MNRRTFLKSLVAGTAGILVPQQVMAEPELVLTPGSHRRIWALDSTMVGRYPIRDVPDYVEALNPHLFGAPPTFIDGDTFDWMDDFNADDNLRITAISNRITVGNYQADYFIMDGGYVMWHDGKI
jgi:hypothetical protein